MQRPGAETIRAHRQPPKTKQKTTKLQIIKLQRKHMVNRVSSLFPKGSHSATQTKPKII